MKCFVATAVWSSLGLLAACGVDVPVTGIWTQADEMSPAVWNAEVKTRLEKFTVPSLTASQESYSKKFGVEGTHGRKFVYLLEADDDLKAATTSKPQGLTKLCPRYGLLTPISKALVWTSILDALSFSETKYSVQLTYPEKFKDSDGNPVVSTGLFQLSQESARAHGGACQGASTEKLKDADFNVLCSYQILSNQILRTDVLFYEDREFYYWSTFSRGRNPGGFARFMGRLSQLMRDGDRWPQSCGLPDSF
jgi:hypothetical protein